MKICKNKNGVIKYLNGNNTKKLNDIIKDFSIEAHLNEAMKYSGVKPEDAMNDEDMYESLISSQYYEDCQTLLDLTDENINEKIDDGFISRIINYANLKDSNFEN